MYTLIYHWEYWFSESFSVMHSKITKITLCLPEHILLSVLQCSGFHPTSQLAMLVKVFPLQISPHFLPRLCSGKTHTPGGRSLVDHH